MQQAVFSFNAMYVCNPQYVLIFLRLVFYISTFETAESLL